MCQRFDPAPGHHFLRKSPLLPSIFRIFAQCKHVNIGKHAVLTETEKHVTPSRAVQTELVNDFGRHDIHLLLLEEGRSPQTKNRPSCNQDERSVETCFPFGHIAFRLPPWCSTRLAHSAFSGFLLLDVLMVRIVSKHGVRCNRPHKPLLYGVFFISTSQDSS